MSDCHRRVYVRLMPDLVGDAELKNLASCGFRVVCHVVLEWDKRPGTMEVMKASRQP